MSTRLAWTIPALVLAALTTSCSSSSNNTTAPAPVPGPNFSVAFPGAGTLAVPGTSNKIVFNDVGSWGYHCVPHGGSGMTGTINVLAGPPVDSALVRVGYDGTNTDVLRFFPDAVTIHAGGYVRWINVSQSKLHTASRP